MVTRQAVQPAQCNETTQNPSLCHSARSIHISALCLLERRGGRAQLPHAPNMPLPAYQQAPWALQLMLSLLTTLITLPLSIFTLVYDLVAPPKPAPKAKVGSCLSTQRPRQPGSTLPHATSMHRPSSSLGPPLASAAPSPSSTPRLASPSCSLGAMRTGWLACRRTARAGGRRWC